MSKKHARSPAPSKSARGRRTAHPPADGLTVAWMTTLSTAVICEISAAAIRGYVRFAAPHEKLLDMLSAYLLLAAALIGAVLVILTPIVVRRRKSNPPPAIVLAAYVIGAAPWFAMMLQAM